MAKKILILAMVLSLSIMLFGCKSITVDDVSQKIASGEYSSAVKDFNKIDDADKQKLVEQFKQEAEKVKTKYINGEIDTASAAKEIDTMKAISGMEETSKNILIVINNIDASRIAFQSAERLENEGKDIEAIAEYSKVIVTDETNYDKAQAKITKISKKIEDSIPVKVVSTRLEKDIINQQVVNIRLKNTGNKPAKEVIVSVFAYDKNGYPIKVQFGTADYVNCSYDNTIQPNDTTSSDIVWNLYNDSSQVVTQIITVVKKVSYFDETTWENPLYSAMLTKYSGNPIK